MCGGRGITKDEELAESAVREKGSGWRLLKAGEAPSHCISPAIVTGYRPALTYIACLRSVLRIHNETVNIWSHLLGSIFFSVILVQQLFNHSAADWIDHTSLLLQICSYQTALAASALFHTFLCHGPRTSQFWLRLDRAGILLSLFGTYVRVLVAIFHCHPLLRAAHLSVICLLFTSVILLHFGREKRRDTAAPVLPFVGIAVYAVAPLAHWATVAESTSVSVTTFAWLLLPYLQGGLGVAVYLLCLPEKLLPPGTVDLFGSSHQLWHALIFSGMLSWYYLTHWLVEERGDVCL